MDRDPLRGWLVRVHHLRPDPVNLEVLDDPRLLGASGERTRTRERAINFGEREGDRPTEEGKRGGGEGLPTLLPLFNDRERESARLPNNFRDRASSAAGKGAREKWRFESRAATIWATWKCMPLDGRTRIAFRHSPFATQLLARSTARTAH